MRPLPSQAPGRPSGAPTASAVTQRGLLPHGCEMVPEGPRSPPSSPGAAGYSPRERDTCRGGGVRASEQRWSEAAHLPATGLAWGTLLLFRSSSSGT